MVSIRRTTLLLGVVLLTVSCAWAQAKKMRDVLPAPTGEHKVGRITFYWKDSTRVDKAADGSELPRELRVDVWYPAVVNDQCTKADYCADLAAIKSRIGLEGAALATIATHTYSSPPLAAEPAHLPLLLFTPGLSTNANQYTALAEELASHGYVVATVDHPFQSQAIAYPDGRVISIKDAGTAVGPPANEEEAHRRYRSLVEPRVADLRFVLDRVSGLNAGEGDGRFKDQLDLDRVGVFGHSLGGVAAPTTCIIDKRFKAAINMDGHARSMPILPDENGAGPLQPFLELTDKSAPFEPSDEQLAKWKISRERHQRIMAEQARRFEKLMQSISGGSYRVTVPGATHQSFSDGVLWIAANPKEHQRRTQIIRDYVRAFFDKYLRNASDTVLDAETSPYENVIVERFVPQSDTATE